MLSPLSVPMMSDREGVIVSIQMAGSSASFNTAAVTTAGRSVSRSADGEGDAAAVESMDGGLSRVRQADSARTSAVQAASGRRGTEEELGDARWHDAERSQWGTSRGLATKRRQYCHGCVSAGFPVTVFPCAIAGYFTACLHMSFLWPWRDPCHSVSPDGPAGASAHES